MTILIKYYIVRLKISKDDVSFVKVLNGKENLCKVDLRSVLSEALVSLKRSGHIATRCVI